MKLTIRTLILLITIGYAYSTVSCYSCFNETVKSCQKNNRTVICPFPANECYSVIYNYDNKKHVSKSCIWNGHCTELFVCSLLHSECTLSCCNVSYCNMAAKLTSWPQLYIILLLYSCYNFTM